MNSDLFLTSRLKTENSLSFPFVSNLVQKDGITDDNVLEMLTNHGKNDTEEIDFVDSFWATTSTAEFPDTIGEFFNYNELRECIDDPAAVIQLEEVSVKSNESGSSNSNVSEHEEARVYSSLDVVPAAPSTPNPRKNEHGNNVQPDWPAFIPLESSTKQIQGNEIRQSPKHSPIISKDSIQVQVPPLKVPIIRTLEDTTKHEVIKRRGRKPLEGLKKQPLKKKVVNLKKGNEGRKNKRRNLEMEFEESSTSQKAPTITIHHHAIQSTQNCSSEKQSPNDYHGHNSFDDAYQNKGGSLSNYTGQPQMIIFPNKVSTVECEVGSPITPMHIHPKSVNQHLGNQKVSDGRDKHGEPIFQKGFFAFNGMQGDDQHGSHYNPSNKIQKTELHELARRSMYDGNSNSSLASSRTRSPPPSRSRPSTPCNGPPHPRYLHDERYNTNWTVSALSPVERLFRNRISEVSEVRERPGDVQKFMKNSQLYKQLVEPIKIEQIAAKSSGKSHELENSFVPTSNTSPESPYFKRELHKNGYNNYPNEWTKLPNASVRRYEDLNSIYDEYKYNDFNKSRDRSSSEVEYILSNIPYKTSPSSNGSSFTMNSNPNNKHVYDHLTSSPRLGSSEKIHCPPNWIQHQSIPRDYESMYNEIIKLRFCINSERSRSQLLLTENANLRQLLNLERIQQQNWSKLPVKQVVVDDVRNKGPNFFQENGMNPGTNMRQNGLMSSRDMSSFLL